MSDEVKTNLTGQSEEETALVIEIVKKISMQN
jgi:hypothetical protein